MVTCTKCGEDNQDTARACRRCGQPLAPGQGLLPAGAVLQGRYRIEAVLGQGAMGVVYAARHLNLGERLAVKEMREDLLSPAERPQVIAQFRQEALVLARLQHPNLPRVWDHFAEGGRWYLVMDVVEGRTLAEVQAAVGGGPLPEAQVLGWAEQLCDVLDYLHRQSPPLVFRDLKPANSMVDAQGLVKLIDFGIARLFDPAKRTDTLKMGTVGYAPPEQYAGHGQTTPRSDVYALGATLHQLLTGADPTLSPFVFSPPKALNPRVSARVSDAVMKALTLDPAGRFASAGEMKQALVGRARSPGPGWRTTGAAALGAAVLILLLSLAAIAGAYLLGALPRSTDTPGARALTPTLMPVGAQTPVTIPASEGLTPVPPSASVSTATAITLGRTDTPDPVPTEPTDTPVIVPSVPPPSRTPTPTRRRGGSGPSPTSPPPPAPVLLAPDPNKSAGGHQTFEWAWSGGSMPAGWAFDLLIWSEAENQSPDWDNARRGAQGLLQGNVTTVDLDQVATIQEHGEGQYYWTVIVVRVSPYLRIGQWGEERPLTYDYVPPMRTPAPTPAPTPIPPPCASSPKAQCGVLFRRCRSTTPPLLCGVCVSGAMGPIRREADREIRL